MTDITIDKSLDNKLSSLSTTVFADKEEVNKNLKKITSSQTKLNKLSKKYEEKIKALEEQLELVKSKIWKYKEGDALILKTFQLVRVVEKVDKNPHYMYKAELLKYSR